MPDDLDCATLSLEEARKVLGYGATKAYDLARRNAFPGQLPRIGKEWRISRRQLAEWLATATPDGDLDGDDDLDGAA